VQAEKLSVPLNSLCHSISHNQKVHIYSLDEGSYDEGKWITQAIQLLQEKPIGEQTISWSVCHILGNYTC